MISIIITAFKEPKTIGKAIQAFLDQNIKEKYEIIAAAPDPATSSIIKKYAKKHPQVKYFKDPGQGKMLALNLLFKKVKGNILILTDGDVFVSKNSVKEILNAFKDPTIGCVGGHPISLNSKNTMIDYWSHLLTDAANITRIRRSKKGQYLTCSGYLFAFRNGLIKSFPRDIPEDAYIPAFFLFNGYKIKYLQNVKVFVKYPSNFKEWLSQKKRISKAYENLKKVKINNKEIPKMKSFLNELLEGSMIALSHPRNIKEFFWALALFPARLYMWFLTFSETKIKKKKHTDSWARVESTK